MKILTFIFSLAILATHSCTTQNAMKKSKDNSFETLTYSEFGGNTDATTEWVQNQEEWESMWQKLNAYQTPTPTLPKVDFENQSVIVFNFGEKSHGGFQFDVKEIAHTDNGLEVTFVSPKQAPTAPVASVMTQPYLILSIPKTETQDTKRNFTTE